MSESPKALIPVLGGAAVLGGLAFSLMGFATGYILRGSDVETVQRAPTDAELEAACDAIVPLGSHTGRSWPDQDFYPITGRKIG